MRKDEEELRADKPRQNSQSDLLLFKTTHE